MPKLAKLEAASSRTWHWLALDDGSITDWEYATDIVLEDYYSGAWILHFTPVDDDGQTVWTLTGSDVLDIGKLDPTAYVNPTDMPFRFVLAAMGIA